MADSTTTDAPVEDVQETSAEAPKPEAPKTDAPEVDADDFKEKFEGQRKVNRDLERKFKEASEERDRLKAASEGKEAEWETDRKSREQADLKFQERIFASELKAAGAAERVKHPEMLQKIINSTDFPLDDEGNLDSGAITEAVKAAIIQYDLAVKDGKRFQGTPDAGARKESGPSQITRDQVKKMSPAEISAAFDAGLLTEALGPNSAH